MKNILVISEHLKNDKDARGRLYGLKVYDALVKTGIEMFGAEITFLYKEQAAG